MPTWTTQDIAPRHAEPARRNHITAKTESKVTRTLDAICLRPAQSQQGGHELADLNSGELITWNIVHKTPVTDVVTKAIETVACNHGFESLKFENRHGVICHDAGWIAGADCNDDNEDEEDHDKERHHEEAQDDQCKEELKEQEQIDPSGVDNTCKRE